VLQSTDYHTSTSRSEAYTHTHTHPHEHNGGAKGARGHVVVYMHTQRGMYKHALVLVHTAHQLSQA
jgi:hypothetical protein